MPRILALHFGHLFHPIGILAQVLKVHQSEFQSLRRSNSCDFASPNIAFRFTGNPVMSELNGSFDFQIPPNELVSRPTSAKSMPSIGRKRSRRASNTPPAHRRSLPETILHKRVEDPLGRFKCSCNRIFKGEKKKSARNNLQRHIEEKTNSRRWACAYRHLGCEHRGARKSNARQHMRNCRKRHAANTPLQPLPSEPIDTWQS